MNCETARELLDLTPSDSDLQAHLRQCLACRAEARFTHQVLAAVSALPRVAAPASLSPAVMASVRRNIALPAHPRKLMPLLLRPWELGWVALMFLLVLAAVPAIVASRPPRGIPMMPTQSFAEALLGASAAFDSWKAQVVVWWEALSSDLGRLSDLSPSGAGRSMIVWACGAVAFILGFHLLLTWQGRGGAAISKEDAHA